MKVSYPFQHWILTTLISPILLLTYDHLFDPEMIYGDASAYLMLVYFGAIFSLPALVITTSYLDNFRNWIYPLEQLN